MTRLDALRKTHPDLGFAVYAIEASGPVTLEVYTPDGQVFQFKGVSEEAVLEQAFPALAPEQITTEAAITAPVTSVFD